MAIALPLTRQLNRVYHLEPEAMATRERLMEGNGLFGRAMQFARVYLEDGD